MEVLYYDSGGSSGIAQFTVDLSKQTQPYQVILARMARCSTLGEAARMLQDRAAAFKSDPNYAALQRLGYGDTLVVPDVLYKLMHHFNDLLDKHFGNPKWAGYYFFDALQEIDFTLSRTGVILKSKAHLGAKTAAVRKQRSLYFDRPFLICVQKREPNATPFFLMWVDNAELMKPYETGGKRS